MRFRVLVVLASACLASGHLVVPCADGWAQSKGLNGPSHPSPDEPATAPANALRPPVHQLASSTDGSAPVVPATGSAHPQKPLKKSQSIVVPPAKVPPGKTQGLPAKAPPDVAAASKSGANRAAQSASEVKPTTPNTLPDPEKPEGAAGRLPRFASLRSDDVNMRLGPGTRYRIDWVYKRRDLPVEIEREYDVWRWVRDPDGIRGWVNQATLMARRNFIIQKDDATIRSDPSDNASAVAILKPGVIGRIRSCEAASAWCDVQAGGFRGYLRRQQFWGVLPGEAIAP